uniref:Guanylate-binding protein 1-like n=1 Tax=Erpetoichthys calabaricus TaxID=27687 RepID=A0A8C4T5N9_ERPCA
MASQGPEMTSPVCLIENTASGLQMNQEALEILSRIEQPVVVVAIVGLYRTGKSYLMNKLAGQKSGFSLGSTIQSHTKGIWVWCVPHPVKADHTLVLLDTEGLGDVEKGDTKNDCWIFALAILLGSSFVYNSRGTIDNQGEHFLNTDGYVTELTDLIKVKSQADNEEEDDIHYVRFFPNFVWAVRDFTLELKIEGKDVTQDEYLENALSLRKGTGKKVSDYNLPRQCIRNFFPTRKCFVFVPPTAPEKMKNMEFLPETELCPTFVQATREFYHYVFQQSDVKKLKGGHKVTGRMLGSLATTYVETIRSGAVPCLENAVIAMAQIENESAAREGLTAYQEGMKQSLNFPETQEELSQKHAHWEKQALEIFMKRSFKDENHEHQNNLAVSIHHMFSKLTESNLTFFLRFYFLFFLSSLYFFPQLFHMPYDHINLDCPNEGEKERVALAEQQIKAEEERRLQIERLYQDEKQSHEENLRQLKLKMEEEMEKNRIEAEEALNSKLKEQEELLKRGFEQQSRMMQDEINDLKKDTTAGFLLCLCVHIKLTILGITAFFFYSMFKVSHI